MDNDVTLDLDINSKPVAFEFLNASELFNLDKGYFKNLVSISIQAAITEENICLNVHALQLYGKTIKKDLLPYFSYFF